MRKSNGNGVVKKAIIWAMSFMMTFTPVFGSVGSITALAATDEDNDNAAHDSDDSDDNANDGNHDSDDNGDHDSSDNGKHSSDDAANDKQDSGKKDPVEEKKNAEEIHDNAEKDVQNAQDKVEDEDAKEEIKDVAYGIGDVHATERDAFCKENKAGEELQNAITIIENADATIDSTVVVTEDKTETVTDEEGKTETVVVEKEKLDENGHVIYKKDENGNIVYKTEENGEIILDEDKNPIPDVETETVTIIVYGKDEKGNPIVKTEKSENGGLLDQSNAAYEEARREIEAAADKIGEKKEETDKAETDKKDQKEESTAQDTEKDNEEIKEEAKDLNSCIDKINDAADKAQQAETEKDYESAKDALTDATEAFKDAESAYNAANENLTNAKNELDKAQAAYDEAVKISKEAAEKAEKELQDAIKAAEKAEAQAKEAKDRVDVVVGIVDKVNSVLDKTTENIYKDWNESIKDLSCEGGSADQLVDAVEKLEGNFTNPEMKDAVEKLAQSLVDLAEQIKDAEAMKNLDDYAEAVKNLAVLSAQFAEAKAQYTIACEAMKQIDNKVVDQNGNEFSLNFKDENGEIVDKENAQKRLDEVNNILSDLEETIASQKQAMETLGVIYELELGKSKTELAASKLATTTAQKAAEEAQKALEEAEKTGNAVIIAAAKLAAENAAKLAEEAQQTEKKAEEAVAGQIISNEMINRDNNETVEKVETDSEYAKYTDAEGNEIAYWVVKDAEGNIVKRYTYEMSENGVDVIELKTKETTTINGKAYDVIEKVVDNKVVKVVVSEDGEDIPVYADANGEYYIQHEMESEQKGTVELGKIAVPVVNSKLDLENLNIVQKGIVEGILWSEIDHKLTASINYDEISITVNANGNYQLNIPYTYTKVQWFPHKEETVNVIQEVELGKEKLTSREFVTVDGKQYVVEEEKNESGEVVGYYYTVTDESDKETKVSIYKDGDIFCTRDDIELETPDESEKEIYIPDGSKAYTDIQRQLLASSTKYAQDKLAYDSANAVLKLYQDSLAKREETASPVLDKIFDNVLDKNNFDKIGEIGEALKKETVRNDIKEIASLMKDYSNASTAEKVLIDIIVADKLDDIRKELPDADIDWDKIKELPQLVIELDKEINDDNSFLHKYIGAIKAVRGAREKLEDDIKEGSDAVSKVVEAALEVVKAGKDIPTDSAKVVLNSVKAAADSGKETTLIGTSSLDYVTQQLHSTSILIYVTKQLQSAITGKVKALQKQTDEAYEAAKAATETLNGLKLEGLSSNYATIKELEAKLPGLWELYNQSKQELDDAKELLDEACNTVDQIAAIEEGLRSVEPTPGTDPSDKPAESPTDKPEDKPENKPQDGNNGNGSSSLSERRNHSSSKSNTTVVNNGTATITLIDDEAIALAATLEDTTFVPEFTTIDEEATALADGIPTVDMDSTMQTGDTSMIPMVASTAMAMGFAAIGGAYGLTLRRRSKKNK